MAVFPKTIFALFKNTVLFTIITYFHVYSERAVSSDIHHDLFFLHFRSTLSEILVADMRSSSTLSLFSVTTPHLFYVMVL